MSFGVAKGILSFCVADIITQSPLKSQSHKANDTKPFAILKDTKPFATPKPFCVAEDI